MCGIFVRVTKVSKESSKNEWDEVLRLVHNRGPDVSCECNAKFLDWNMEFFGSVLWMQGEKPLLQPSKDEKGNILLWNGDIFNGPWVAGDEGDTSIVLNNIFGHNASEESILKSITAIQGPYSFVYWCENRKKLWFGRDRIGRHSLLCYFDGDTQLVLTSVGKRGIPFFEVPVVGIFVIDFSEDSYNITIYRWSDVLEKEVLTIKTWQIPIQISKLMVNSPVCTICPISYHPTAEYNRILNQAFLKMSSFYDILLSNTEISTRVEFLLECLKKAVKVRSQTQPGMCKECVISVNGLSNNKIKCTHPKLGILFSGGLDSTIIAALAHEFIPPGEPIDLFNVAFENGNKNITQTNLQFTTPDRKTGIHTCEELKKVYPSRQWNFIQIDITKNELNSYRRTRIGDLIHPLSSVLDDSLGCALWFASRLCGTLNSEEYRSPARILLLGMGADEQFGGYMRHRTILQHQGWSALAEEIDLELQRIASRNLGRDDRIVSDHGCQARFPFLDEDVINFVSSLPVWTRCYPTSKLPPGFGDKLMLRLVAWKLGLKNAAQIPKRAFQFGSRIAKSKEKASDVSSRLKI